VTPPRARWSVQGPGEVGDVVSESKIGTRPREREGVDILLPAWAMAPSRRVPTARAGVVPDRLKLNAKSAPARCLYMSPSARRM